MGCSLATILACAGGAGLLPLAPGTWGSALAVAIFVLFSPVELWVFGLTLVALFFLGGEVIHAFALALIIGIFVGTYSSIYVAGALALLLGVSKADLMPVQKEGAEVDEGP